MPTDSPELLTSERPKVIRLARNGTVLARSSDFTRASAILHISDVEINTDGYNDQSRANNETTAGVGFVSAASRLDRIFQKDFESKKSGAAPPPPPPPPHTPLTQSLPPLPLNASLPPPLNNLSNDIAHSNSTSSDLSSATENPTHVSAPSPAPRSPIAAPPPIQGMFARTPTRHRKLIKTRLSHLPDDLQDQEPQIRGGVAIYKVTHPVQREQYGTMVEINAIDYIDKLRDTIQDLERKYSLLQGRFDQQTIPANKHTVRPSLRMATFMNKRFKESDSKAQDSPVTIPRGKTSNTFAKRPPTRHPPKPPQIPTLPSSNRQPPTNSASEGINSNAKKNIANSEPQLVSFPNGFGFNTPQPSAKTQSKTPTVRRLPKGLNSHTMIPAQMKVNFPTAIGAQPSSRKPSSEEKLPTLTKEGRNKSDTASAPLSGATQSQSSVDEDPSLSLENQLSEPPSPRKGLDMAMSVTKTLQKTFELGNASQGDRNAAPMPAVEASRRTRRAGVAGRTHSFSGHGGNALGRNLGNTDKPDASRTFSLHRESDALPPKKPEAKRAKKSRGVRRLLGLR